MEKLIINKGYKEYQINDDENAVIRVKTTDFSLIDRLSKLKDNVSAIVKEMEAVKKSEDADTILTALAEADQKIKQELDRVFDDNVAAVVFGDMNCLSFAGGQPVAMNFLEAIIPQISKDFEKEKKASDKRIKKYTDAAKQFK